MLYHQNAFSDRLSSLGLDMFRIVAVDILHEVEIGVWKALFIHLLRVLESIDKSLINVLNSRLVIFLWHAYTHLLTATPTRTLTGSAKCLASETIPFAASGVTCPK